MLKMMHRILCTRYLGGGENGFPHALKILVLHFCLIYKIWYSDGLFSVKVSYLMWIFISFLSVKIWLANIEGLNRCTNAEEVPFALVAKVHNKHQPSIVFGTNDLCDFFFLWVHVNLIWHAYYAMKLSSLTKVLTPIVPFARSLLICQLQYQQFH